MQQHRDVTRERRRSITANDVLTSTNAEPAVKVGTLVPYTAKCNHKESQVWQREHPKRRLHSPTYVYGASSE